MRQCGTFPHSQRYIIYRVAVEKKHFTRFGLQSYAELLLILHRNLRFTGNAALAKAATVPVKAEMGFNKRGRLLQVRPAFELVMPPFGHCAGRAAVDTFAASTLSEKKTVGAVVLIRPACRRNGEAGDHRAAAHGLALGSD